MKNQKILFAVVLIIVASASFFGGMKYQQSKTPSFSSRFQDFQGMRNIPADSQNGNRARIGGDQTIGEIISADDTGITIKLADGSTKNIIVPDSATINKTDTGAKTDLTMGTSVIVFGSANSDGSITAQSIQLNPNFRAPSRQPNQN